MNGKAWPNAACDCVFPVKEARKPKNREQQLDLGFGKTLNALMRKVKQYAKEVGGVKKLLEQIASLEEIAMQADGSDGLKEALKALEEI